MNEPDTPESLLEFFRMLAPDGQEADESCQIHYGCQCVLKKGLLAAQMLVEARSGAAPQGEGAPEGNKGAGDEELAQAMHVAIELDKALEAAREAEQAQAAALAAEKTRTEGLLKQNMKLANENIELKQKVMNLQKQVNRLYDTMHMKSIHGSLHKDEAAPPVGVDEAARPVETPAAPVESAPETPAAAETPEPAAEPQAPPPAPPTPKPATLEDQIMMDSAARVPREPKPEPEKKEDKP